MGLSLLKKVLPSDRTSAIAFLNLEFFVVWTTSVDLPGTKLALQNKKEKNTFFRFSILLILKISNTKMPTLPTLRIRGKLDWLVICTLNLCIVNLY